MGQGDPSLAQCTTRPVKALSPTSPQHRPTERGEEASQRYTPTQYSGVRPTGETGGMSMKEGLVKGRENKWVGGQHVST